jgi:Flp pilus assembly protein TadD
MKNKLILLLGFAMLTACSSGSKNSDDSSNLSLDSDSPYQAESAPTKSKNDSARADRGAEEPKPVVATTRSDAQVLIDAVKSGQDDSIAKAAEMVLSKNPNDAKALNALGLYHYKKGHYPAAIMMLEKALKAEPNLSEAHNNLGLTYLAQKENRDAIKEFRKAIEVNPNDGIAAANLGSIYIEHKDYNKALVAMEIAYKKNSKDPKILNNYGIALAAAGKYNEARDMYKQALSANSGNKDVMLNYAILLIENLNKKDEGLDLLGKIRFLGPSPEARNRINVLENKAKAGLK